MAILLASPSTHNSTNTTMSTTYSTISHSLSFMITTTIHSAMTLSTSTLPQRHQYTHPTIHNTSPSPINPHPPSTTTAKSKTTPSNTQSEHLPFTFHFIPNCPNYISKLKLPMYLAKLCTDIQHNVESSIIKIVEEHPGV